MCEYRSAPLLRNRGIFRVFSPALDFGKMEIFKQEHAGQRPVRTPRSTSSYPASRIYRKKSSCKTLQDFLRTGLPFVLKMKVLIVDADPQSDVSAGFRYRDCDDSK